MKWKTKDGRILDIKDMSDQHIINAIDFCKKRNKQGVTVFGGYDVEDMSPELDYHFLDDDIVSFEKELEERQASKIEIDCTLSPDCPCENCVQQTSGDWPDRN